MGDEGRGERGGGTVFIESGDVPRSDKEAKTSSLVLIIAYDVTTMEAQWCIS